MKWGIRNVFSSGRRTIVGTTTLAALLIGGVTWGVMAATAVPSYIDLTTAGAQQTHDGVIFASGVGPAGTGQFDPFLTVNPGGSAKTELGYNSDAQGVGTTDDDVGYSGSGRTHTLKASAIPPTVVGGIEYREFSLDGNDTGSDDLMSIDNIKIYTDTEAGVKGYVDGAGCTPGTFSVNTGPAPVQIYCLDSAGDTTILMKTQGLSSGSGQSDISVLIPASVFPTGCSYGSITCDKWVTFWFEAGNAGTLPAGTGAGCTDPDACDYDVSGGFEEWRTRKLPVVNVSKTVNTSIDRSYDWTVKKYVSTDPTCETADAGYLDAQTALTGLNIDLFNGQSDSVCWKIVSDRGDPVDSNRQLTGTITIINPTGPGQPISSPISATINSVSDIVSPGGAASVVCPGSFPQTLDPGATLTCTYSKALSSSDAGTNTATAVLDNGDLADLPYSSDAVPFNPATGTVNEVDESATLSDNRHGSFTGLSGDRTDIYTESLSCPSTRTVLNTATLTEGDSATQHTDPAYLNITCHTLGVSKDATPAFGRTFDWSVLKYVSVDGGTTYQPASASVNLFNGGSTSVTWKIDVTKGDPQDAGFTVSGTITINNAGNPAVSGVTVGDSIAGGITATVDCDGTPGAPFTTTLNIAAGGTGTCTYSATLPDSTTRLNTATATLFGTSYTGTASINFTGVTPTVTDDTASLDDDLKTSGFPQVFSASGQVIYSTTESCGTTHTTINTAVLTETVPSTPHTDDARVTVTCYGLNVSKNANTSFKRTWTWTVDKGAGGVTELNLALGQTYQQAYSVTYGATYVDSEWKVTGTITVANPAPIAANGVSVADVVTVGINATVDCDGVVGAPFTTTVNVAASSSSQCTYTADLPNATTRTNTATATLLSHDYTGNASVTFGTTPTTQIDETVNVSDNVPSGEVVSGTPPSGTVTATTPQPFSTTFNYSRQIGPYGSGQCGDNNVDNTAFFTTTDTAATGNDPYRIVVHVPCPTGCTLTQGYWKTHSIRGPAPFDDNWNNIPTAPYAPGPTAGTAENTPFFYSGQTWYQVFWTSPKGGNAYYILAHQYEAAVLNILNGADPSAVSTTLNTALALFSNPLNTPNSIGALKSNNALRAQFVALAGVLGAYNEGTIGPGHCSEDRTTSTAP